MTAIDSKVFGTVEDDVLGEGKTHPLLFIPHLHPQFCPLATTYTHGCRKQRGNMAFIASFCYVEIKSLC